MKSDKQKHQLIDDVARLASSRFDKTRSTLVDSFVRQFYANVPTSDIADETVENLSSAALSLWTFAGKRQPGTAKVRVFNPRQDEHGWRSHNTLVEIVNDDMPFLVDSVTAELNRQDVAVRLVIHPIIRLARDAGGQLSALGGADGHAESMMQIRVTQIAVARHQAIAERLEKVLGDVRVAVGDWASMRKRMADTISQAEQVARQGSEEQASEDLRFLRWLADDHFTLLGCRDYELRQDAGAMNYRTLEGGSLGVLRDPAYRVFGGLKSNEAMMADIRSLARQPSLLLIAKANMRSTVHRDVHMDAIGVKLFDEAGAIRGERIFVGLFTSIAYNRSPREIPMLDRKVENVITRAGFDPVSHDGKALANILETYPRDELFQASEDELLETAVGILQLQERQRIALFIRRDRYDRFVSCLVYMPRDLLNTELRLRMQAIIAQAYAGRVSAFYVHLGDGALARLHLIIATKPGEMPSVDVAALEAQLVEAARSWQDRLGDALSEAKGEAAGAELLRRFRDAFPVGYEEQFNAFAAVHDIDQALEALDRSHPTINLYRPVEAPPSELRLKLYQAGEKIALSTVLPSLENFGLKVISEMPFEVKPEGVGRSVWIHDFIMVTADGAEVDVSSIRDKFHEAYGHIWSGQMEDDGFNRLVVMANMGWRDIALLRAYCKYLRQVAIAFSQNYMEATLNANPTIARLIVKLFYAIHDPDALERESEIRRIEHKLKKRLDAVVNLDEDRILRRYLNAVKSTLRTNYFQIAADGGPKEYISFKLDSHKLEELPLPRPMVEVFVYSPRAEAIHLRGGKVARGGIRWSDRREDFRTEILGLMKAQMVKNSVIVPVGSKGGFVVKRPPQSADRETVMAEVVHCYKTLMRGLLDITDNLAGSKIVAPKRVRRLDEDDPYLVVAADKGTATFSDIANSVSREYGFWLDDAFASGGSAGYDHKKMGITARGAWECVKRHFREAGTDIQSTDFTCVGVGDMSGDVFGNGMLLSPHTRLLAAFNHMHIFLDPDPDPASSLAERKRLFDLPRSSWADYNAALISAGGGVFERRVKSIALSAQVRARFGIEKEALTPAELIRALLRAPVDLLWLGGIGTYVKESGETDAEVGDRSNDSIRVKATELRCKVVGEGANLGFTQRGRIEAATAGIRINTDALDNSAGVDTSDHEVNIKILLNGVVADGDLTTKQRDQLLAAMTDDVGSLVLRDNYLQSQTVSAMEYLGYRQIDQQNRFMRWLERGNRLDRSIEFLPDDEAVRQRLARRAGLTRPELSVLLAYAKNSLYDELLPSDLPDDPWLVEDLVDYFPVALKQNYRHRMVEHRLRREIIATVVTNSLVNRMGATFVHLMRERTGLGASAIARAYAIARTCLRLREAWAGIQALDNKIAAATQIEMLVDCGRLAEQATQWFLRNGQHPLDIAANVASYKRGMVALEAALPDLLSTTDRADLQAHISDLENKGVPSELAKRVGRFVMMNAALDIVRLASERKSPVEEVAATYYAVGEEFHLDWLREGARALIGDDHWDRLAVFALIDDLYGHQRDLTGAVLAAGNGTGQQAIAVWRALGGANLGRADQLLNELRQVGKLELAMLAVANRALRSLMG
jgi:glutamate dehydrogenase